MDSEGFSHSFNNSTQHNVIFAAWLVCKYGQAFLRGGRLVSSFANHCASAPKYVLTI